MPLLLHSRCPRPVQISSLGTGNRLSYKQTLQTADSEMNIQSGLLLQSWNKREHIEMPYYFRFMALLFTDWSVYFYISNCSWYYKPSGVCDWGFSLSVQVMGKSWPHRQPVITYIYLCGWTRAFCLSYISNSPSRIGQKLNWNVTQALGKIYHWHFIIYGQLVLSPFWQ